jgi:hypothetical protein
MKRGSYIILGLCMLVGILMAGAPIGATDRLGASAIAQCTNVVADYSFEAGYWRDWTSVGQPWFANYWSHEGTWSAVVGGGDDHDDAFYQDVLIPAGATGATFSFWWRVYTQEGSIGTPLAKDWFRAVLRDHLGTEYVVETLSNISPTAGWFHTTFDLDPVELPTLFGHRVRIEFRGATDSTDFTSFYVDEVELIVCGAPQATATATATQTRTPTATPTPSATATSECPIDEYEPNGAPELARPIALHTQHTAWICPIGDTDWYTFPAIAGQMIQIVMAGTDGELPADYDMRLYDPSQAWAASSTKSGQLPEEIALTALSTGDYRLLVYGHGDSWSSAYPYVLWVDVSAPATATPTPTAAATETATTTIVPTPTCIDDEFEENDTWSTAAMVTLPFLDDALHLCPADSDYYRMTLLRGERLTVDLGFRLADGDLALGIYDRWGQNIAYTDDRQENLRIVYDVSVSDIYLVGVTHAGWQGNSVPYALSIQRSESPTSTHTPTLTQTPTATVTQTPIRPQIGLTVWDIEATQGLQNLSNDIILVAGKTTYVRVYVTGDRTPWIAVGDLEGALNGVPLSPPSVPLSTVKMVGSPSLRDIRKDVGYTLHSFLPSSWVAQAGRLTLTAKVMPQGADDPYEGDNQATVTLTIESSPQLHVQAVQVRDGGFLGWGAEGPSYQDYRDVHLIAQQLYPVARIQLHPHKHSIPWLTGPLTLVALAQVDLLDRDPGPNTIIMGMVREQAWAPLADGMGLPTRHCWVKIKASGSQYLAAHEMSHGFGMWHVEACGEHIPFEPYPYPPQQISWGAFRDYWGLHIGIYPPEVFPGDERADVMTYCGSQWISPYTYGKLRRILRASLAPSASDAGPYRVVRPLADVEYLMALGTIAPDGDSVVLVSTLRIAGRDLDPQARTSPEGDYRLQLLAKNDSVLAEVPFGPMEGNHQEEARPWSVLIPWHPSTARVVVTHHGQELTSETVSAHAPTVQFDPVGDVVTNTLACSWTATDADGDTLSATLLFSADDGETWEPVASGVAGQRYALDATFWPETNQARLRILVSDGLNTSAAQSNAFSVPARAPMAFIVAPGDSTVVTPGEPVLLRATGYDAEDGPLPQGAYAWTSDVDGVLGTGEELVAVALSQGWHTIALVATDSDGHASTDSIRVLVGHALRLPLVLR